MVADKKTLKFQMMMSPGEAEILDDWMFKNRIRSRAEAIRRLTQIALAIEPMVEEITDLTTQNGVALGKLGLSIWYAKSDIDGEGSEKLLNDLDRDARDLSLPALELNIRARKLQGIYASLKEGDDLPETLKKIESETEAFEELMRSVKLTDMDQTGN